MTGDGHEELWKSVAEGGVERVLAQYTWDLHARELIKLSKIYGFWNYVNREMTMPLNSYVDTLYQLPLPAYGPQAPGPPLRAMIPRFRHGMTKPPEWDGSRNEQGLRRMAGALFSWFLTRLEIPSRSHRTGPGTRRDRDHDGTHHAGTSVE